MAVKVELGILRLRAVTLAHDRTDYDCSNNYSTSLDPLLTEAHLTSAAGEMLGPAAPKLQEVSSGIPPARLAFRQR